MGGVYFENTEDYKNLKPDLWIKFYPLKMITGATTGFDFSIGLNYMDGVRYGIGISIPTIGGY
jgi:hypothetical protein